jgi:trimeric autotransporter adhesin
MKHRLTLAAALAAAISVAIGLAGDAGARTGPPPAAAPLPVQAWTTDQPVAALAQANGRLYLGGSFTRIGPVTGGGVALGAGDASYQAYFPFVLGRIYAVIPDGTGGYFVGGKFNLIGGLPRTNLAHVRSDGSVDPGFAPYLDGAVYALARDGTRLYAGGDFLHANDEIRRRLAAFDTTNGFVDHGFNPGVDGPVLDLALAPGRLFVAGLFVGISGNARTTLAAVDPATGALDPNFDAAPDGAVVALQVIGDRLFAGGTFHTINGRSRTALAAFDVATGDLVSGFSPSVNGRVYELASDGTHLFVGGRFTEVERSFNTSLASVDPQTGRASQDFRAFVDGDVRALAAANGRLYVGGSFLKVDGQPVDRLASVDPTSGAVDTGFRPDPDNDVRAVAANGITLYAGGVFTSAPRFPAYGLAAVNATTGVWDPAWQAGVADLQGHPSSVGTLGVYQGRLYAGGGFEVANSTPRRGIAAFDLGTGATTSFRADVNGGVRSFAFGSRRLYIGGDFDHVRKQFHEELAAVDPESGAPDPRFNPGKRKAPGPVDEVFEVAAAGGRLFVAGSVRTGYVFRKHGHRRVKEPVYEAVVSLNPRTGGVVHRFKSLVDGYTTAIAASSRRVFVGGDISRISGYKRKKVRRHGKLRTIRVPQYRYDLVGLDPRTGRLDLRFHPLVSGVDDLAQTERGLFAFGGDLFAYGQRRRDGVALLDPASGTPDADFHPQPRLPANSYAGVSSVASYPGHVALAGDFSWIGPVYQPHVAILPTP